VIEAHLFSRGNRVIQKVCSEEEIEGKFAQKLKLLSHKEQMGVLT
jgi:hypothetical protein